MMPWLPLGNYLGREIRVIDNASLDRSLSAEQLNGSLLMIVADFELIADAQQRTFFNSVISSSSLAIMLFGNSAEVAFDLLIALLSDAEPTRHIMTKYLNTGTLEDAVKDFIGATWPSEERFDEWKNYSIVIIAQSRLQEIQTIVKELRRS